MQKMSNKLIKWALLAALPFVVFGCQKYDLDKIASNAWEPTLAVPIVDSRFNVSSILSRGDTNTVSAGPDGLISIIYTGRDLDIPASTVFSIPNINLGKGFLANEIGIPSTDNFESTASFNSNESFQLGLGSVDIAEILFNGGNLSVNLSSTFNHPVTVTLTFPDLINNSTPLSLSLISPFIGVLPSVSNAAQALNGYNLDLTDDGSTFNTFRVDIQIIIDGNGNAISGNEEINLNFGINNANYDRVFGDFGLQDLYTLKDTIEFRIFENSTDGYFELVNPTLTFNVRNSFGFPSIFNFLDLRTIDLSTGEEYEMIGFPNPININYPSTAGQVASTEFQFNKENTNNIINVISPVPKIMTIDFRHTSNPFGPPQQLNFLTGNGNLTIESEIEMPLEGLARGFRLVDTIPFDFAQSIEQIQEVMFRFNFNNGFPVDLFGTLNILDADKNFIASIIPEELNFIQSASVDASGRVSAPTRRVTDVTIDQDRAQQLLVAKYVAVSVESETLGAQQDQMIKLYDDSFLEFKMGMVVKGSVAF
jgi:hypothetical protein